MQQGSTYTEKGVVAYRQPSLERLRWRPPVLDSLSMESGAWPSVQGKRLYLASAYSDRSRCARLGWATKTASFMKAIRVTNTAALRRWQDYPFAFFGDT